MLCPYHSGGTLNCLVSHAYCKFVLFKFMVFSNVILAGAGSFRPQKFIPYGALYGAPLLDDSIVVGRKDYSYAEPTTGAPPPPLPLRLPAQRYVYEHVRGQELS